MSNAGNNTLVYWQQGSEGNEACILVADTLVQLLPLEAIPLEVESDMNAAPCDKGAMIPQDSPETCFPDSLCLVRLRVRRLVMP